MMDKAEEIAATLPTNVLFPKIGTTKAISDAVFKQFNFRMAPMDEGYPGRPQ
jgi:hypothetical protein